MQLSFSYNLHCLPLGLSYFLSTPLSIPHLYRPKYCVPSNYFIIPYHVVSNIYLFHKTNTHFFVRLSPFFSLLSLAHISFVFTQITWPSSSPYPHLISPIYHSVCNQLIVCALITALHVSLLVKKESYER